MLVALDARRQRTVAETTLGRDDQWICPLCRQAVILKAGRVVIPHFAHKARGLCAAEGESRRHLAAKKLFYDELTSRGLDVSLEVMLAADRRADLLVASPRGRFTIEVQDSRISVEEMKAREAQDKRAGCVTTCWVFTEKRLPGAVFAHLETTETTIRTTEVRVAADIRYRWNATHLPVLVLRGDRLFGLTLEPIWRDGEDYYDEYGDYQSRDGRWLQTTFTLRYDLLGFTPVLDTDRYGRGHVGFAPATQRTGVPA
jgi:hypothetical protein